MAVVFIGLISVRVLLKNNSMGTYYLFRAASWVHFAKSTENMDSENLSYGTVYSKNKLDSNDTKLINELIQKGNNDTKTIFGNLTSYPFRIVVYPTTEEYQKWNNAGRDSLGSADSSAIYLPINELNEYNFVHEYTHFKMQSFCKDDYINLLAIPMWFREGVAEYISFQYRENRVDKSHAKIKNFKEISDQEEFVNARLDGYDMYFQSYLAIKKIIELKGEDSIKNILLDSKNMDFYSAFYKDLGLSIEDFQKLLK